MYKIVERGEKMKKKLISTGLALGATLSIMIPAVSPVHAQTTLNVTNVEFVGMDAPTNVTDMAKVQTSAKVKVTYSDGSTKEVPLAYNKLFQTNDKVATNQGVKIAAGTPIDAMGNPIMDKSVPGDVVPFVSDAPDSNSLLNPQSNDGSLSLVTQYEYQTLDHSGSSAYGKVPASLTVSKLMQNMETGELKLESATKVDTSAAGGVWITCNGSLSPWNTHLSSEEYEPDARAFEANATTDPTNVKSFATYFYGDVAKANPYNYGFIPEVTVNADGSSEIVKHYSVGRKSNELMKVMADKKTAFFGDDGSYTTMFMYVADKEEDLSAGTLYAAKFNQTSTDNGGSGDLQWVKLGHATDSEVKTIIDSGVKFSDIFEVSDTAKDGYKAVKTYANSNKVEYLKLKPGMEKAAAFLESRRYAAYIGATAEFNKMEGVSVNTSDKKLYIAITDISKGMADGAGKDPVDDVHLPVIKAGATFELPLQGGQKDSNGAAINSNYVASSMKALVVGEDLAAPDAYGNTANPDKVANTDNLSYSEEMRTLFIGEDSGKHINNFVWAYNVDTKKLSRILSVPAGAEATGLQVADNRNGFSYIMSNFQHPGDELDNYKPTAISISSLKDEVNKFIGIDKAGIVGYLNLGDVLHQVVKETPAPDNGNTNNGGQTPATDNNGGQTPATDNGNTSTPTSTTDTNTNSTTPVSTTNDSKKLPDTATTVYSMLGLGALLAAIGAYFLRRKKAAK